VSIEVGHIKLKYRYFFQRASLPYHVQGTYKDMHCATLKINKNNNWPKLNPYRHHIVRKFDKSETKNVGAIFFIKIEFK
jgi:hypothetical protein